MAEKRINPHGDGDGDGGLHLDLWIDILSLLPAKTLNVLGAVCKSFRSIIDDSSFVSLHLRRFPNNLRRFPITVRNSDHRLTTSQALDIICHEFSNCLFLKGSLDGLLLLVTTRRSRDGSQIAELLNPSIRKRRPLPLPLPELTQFGLGCHRNDYKVVAARASSDEAWIYSVKTGSWTEISNTGLHCKAGRKSTRFCQSLSFKDMVFWMELHYNGYSTRRRLVWFEFGSERFRYTDETFNENFKAYKLVMLDGGSSVGVWGTNAEKKGSLWALEANRTTWTRRYEIAQPYAKSLCRTLWCVEKDGELVLKYMNGKQDVVTVFSYDIIKTKTIKHDEMAIGDCMGLYFESLVMLH